MMWLRLCLVPLLATQTQAQRSQTSPELALSALLRSVQPRLRGARKAKLLTFFLERSRVEPQSWDSGLGKPFTGKNGVFL